MTKWYEIGLDLRVIGLDAIHLKPSSVGVWDTHSVGRSREAGEVLQREGGRNHEISDSAAIRVMETAAKWMRFNMK